jgi:hypothetical protein
MDMLLQQDGGNGNSLMSSSKAMGRRHGAVKKYEEYQWCDSGPGGNCGYGDVSVGGSGGGGGGEHVNCAGSWARFLEHEDTEMTHLFLIWPCKSWRLLEVAKH